MHISKVSHLKELPSRYPHGSDFLEPILLHALTRIAELSRRPINKCGAVNMARVPASLKLLRICDSSWPTITVRATFKLKCRDREYAATLCFATAVAGIWQRRSRYAVDSKS